MLDSQDCLDRYGRPDGKTNMTLWTVPAALVVGKLPRRVFCNVDLIDPLHQAFVHILDRGLVGQVESWDGCHNIRQKRGASTWSLHAWGVAIDLNAASNGFGKPPTMSQELVACFTDAGFDWGGTWRKPDGMHFQLRALPELVA